MSKLQSVKIALLIAMIAVMALLIHRWDAKYEVKSDLNSPTRAAQSSGAPNLSLGQVNPSSKPTIVQPSTPAHVKSLQAGGKTISVNTPLLDTKINLDGANLVYANLQKFPATLKNKVPLNLLNNQSDTFYIAQSGLIVKGFDLSRLTYRSAQSSYTVKDKTQTIDLIANTPSGVKVIKQYTFYPDKYRVGVNYRVTNNTGKPIDLRFYGQLLRKPPAKHKGGLLMHYATFTGGAYSTTDSHFEKLSFSNMADSNLNQSTKGGWVSMVQHYFISAWVPSQSTKNELYSRKLDNDIYSIGVANPSVRIANGQTANTGATLYVGPALSDRLEATAPYLNLTIDYGWLWFISIFLFWVMSHIYSIVGNWGVAIILVTICIKIVFYPLSAKSFRSMAKMRMLQPKMQKLKEQFGDDRQALGRATMEMYRKEKVNPLSGCLPILIQIPVFIALYWMLMASVELRQAPFIFWIKDLSVHDPYFVLPILMGLSMFLQQRLNPPPPDPMQAKIIMALPLVFTLLFLGFPSGLVLYWLVNNCVGILQQWYVLRKVEHERR